MSTTSYKRKGGLNATAYSYLVEALYTAPRSLAELKDLAGMQNAAARAIKALRDRGMLHVSGWRTDAHGRMTIREYRLGPGQDAPCPTVPRAVVIANYRARRQRRLAEERAAARPAGPPPPKTGRWCRSSPSPSTPTNSRTRHYDHT